uniref:TcfC E-set like domain-containing protein n=1 Tax=Altererythrobacter segetis TaxID=1104773 RepID=UPI00140727E6|nr:TcfC E-set like domain-containing protein [Altererythrobacter segetis]
MSNLRSFTGCRGALALGCAAVATSFLPAQARAGNAPVISVGEPDGFAELTGDQTLLVDVYFGGVRLGEALVVATPDNVRVKNPVALFDLLPAVTDQARVQAALAAPDLRANSALACSTGSDRDTCGRLSPEIVGVILDRQRLRLDVFLNPRLLVIHDNVEERYLPTPTSGLSMTNGIGAVLSGQSGTGRNFYNLQDRLVLANGTRRLRADMSYATNHGLEAERLAFEWDRAEVRYSAGALWAPGTDLTGRRKLLGLGIESQVDTRLDKDQILGSPVVVYLDRRARVDVVRDGRVLNSAIYEAGNQQVNSANLPEGSYQIVLRIDEPGGRTREERRFFTKSRRIPSPGRTDFFAFGGVFARGGDPGALLPSRHPYFEAGIGRRMNQSWAVEGKIEASDKTASMELGATLLTQFAQVRAAAIADFHGRFGGILQLASNGFSRLNFSFDLRRLDGGSMTAGPTAGPVGGSLSNSFGAAGLARLGNSYLQIGGLVSYSMANVRFLGVFSYREDHEQVASYSVGPSLEWDVLRKGPFTLTLRGDMTATERGASEFAGISLRLVGGHASMTALGASRTSSITADDLGDGLVTSLAGTWTTGAAGGDLALGAGFEHQPRQDDLVLSSEFRHPLGSLSGDLVRSDNGPSSVSQYSVGMQTTIIAGGGTVRVAGKTTSDSLVVAHVAGARDGDRFEMLVNEQVAGTIVGDQPLMLPLATYRAYDVRIRPTGKDLLAYDSSPRHIGLYPGAVSRLEWKVAPITIKFGRLVAPDGKPVVRASITGRGVWSETDDNGFFQVEAPDDAELTVTTHDGRSFAAKLPLGEPQGGVVRLGSVLCCGAGEMWLGALDPRVLPVEGTAE